MGHSLSGTLLWVTLVGSSCGALLGTLVIPQIVPLPSDTPRLRQRVSRSPITRHHADALFPPRPRKSQWHCADVICHTVCSHTRSNPITRYRQSSCSPATRRVYASMFRPPHWHGAMAQIPMALRHHRRRVATRSAHTLAAILSHNTANHPAPHTSESSSKKLLTRTTFARQTGQV